MNTKEIAANTINKIKEIDHIPVGKILAPLPVIAGICTYEAIKRAIRKAVPPCFYRTVAESVLASSISGYGMMLGIALWTSSMDLPLHPSDDEDDSDFEIDENDPLISKYGMDPDEARDLYKQLHNVGVAFRDGEISAIDAAAKITDIMDGCSDEVKKYLELDDLKESMLKAADEDESENDKEPAGFQSKVYKKSPDPVKEPEEYQHALIEYVKENRPTPMSKSYFMSVYNDLTGDAKQGFLKAETADTIFQTMTGEGDPVYGMSPDEVEELLSRLKRIIESKK